MKNNKKSPSQAWGADECAKQSKWANEGYFVGFIFLLIWNAFWVIIFYQNFIHVPSRQEICEMMYDTAIAEVCQSTSDITDLSGTDKYKLVVNAENKTAYILLIGEGVLFAPLNDEWYIASGYKDNEELPNLYQAYKLEYDIDKLVIYHYHKLEVLAEDKNDKIETREL